MQNQNIGRNAMSAGAAGGTFDPQQALSQHVLKNFYVGGEWVKPLSTSRWARARRLGSNSRHDPICDEPGT
jgi:hypothetical protein